MENLSIVIQGIKIEIKIYQNFLPCLLVLFVVNISGRFSAILASLVLKLLSLYGRTKTR